MKLTAKLFALTTCAALLICPASNTFAQPKPAKPDAKPKPAADTSKAADPRARQITELKFDGIPLGEVAALLSEPGYFPEINFVVSPAIKDAPITLKLRDVTLDDIFTAMDVATSSSVKVNWMTDRMVTFTVNQTVPDDPAKPVCRAFSLARYLAGKSDADAEKALKEVEDALRKCWDMLQAAGRSSASTEAPQLSLHRATKLLIVVGQPSQVDVVAQVVNQLEQGNPTPVAVEIDPVTGFPLAPKGGSPVPNPDEFRRRYGIPPSPSTPQPPSTPKQPGGR